MALWKEIDLLAIMSKPYQPWEEMEKEFEKLDRGAEQNS